MSEPTQRSSLGRGLAALFGEEGADYAALDQGRTTKDVPIEQIHPNPEQPRRHFDEASVSELADSIRVNGILQPILVRRHRERPAEFEIVAGERRWRAAQRARLHSVPVVIRDIDDGQALELALVENLQREDLSALDEAEAYHHLSERFGYTQETLAKNVGKSRSHIANSLRLRALPEVVKSLLNNGRLSAGHARALLAAEDPEAAARQVVEKRLSVRQAEKLVRKSNLKSAETGAKRPSGRSGASPAKDADTLALERDLSTVLGLRVSVDHSGTGGSVTVRYDTLEQLDDLLRRLSQTPDPAAV